jgi:dTDP-4-dehydrorhamnose reductase
MSAYVIGTSGQLATELHRLGPEVGCPLVPPVQFDLTDTPRLRAELDEKRPRLIINAAAYTAVDQAEVERERAFAVNAQGPGELARWCAENEAALIHVSTDYVFDGQKQGAYVEDDATGPLGVYGASKLAGERAVRDALDRHVILRTSWVFSATGHNFVKTILRVAQQRDELRVVADQVGKPTSAAELARAILELARRVGQPAFPWGTYHFACPDRTSWHGFAEAIVDEQAEVTGRRPKVTAITTAEYPTRATRPANSTLDTSRFESTFALKPRAWRDELRAVVRKLAPTLAQG